MRYTALLVFAGLTTTTSVAQTQAPATGSEIRIIKSNEPGIPFTLDVTVLDIESRKPVTGASVFAYQTNYKGDYERDAQGVARIHGTVQSDCKGKVRFITIYPRGYDDSPTGEHIHFQVKKEGYKQVVADLIFADYYRKRYDFDNPFTYKVYLKELEKDKNGYYGQAFIFLKKEK